MSRRERRPKKRKAGGGSSWSGAAEWLLLQYEEIDRKFQIVSPDADENRLGLRTSRPQGPLDLVRGFDFRR